MIIAGWGENQQKKADSGRVGLLWRRKHLCASTIYRRTSRQKVTGFFQDFTKILQNRVKTSFSTTKKERRYQAESHRPPP
jgi:hypothetical protein